MGQDKSEFNIHFELCNVKKHGWKIDVAGLMNYELGKEYWETYS